MVMPLNKEDNSGDEERNVRKSQNTSRKIKNKLSILSFPN